MSRPEMQTVTSVRDLRQMLDEARGAGASVGLVPTMGYLHDGHLSLMHASASATDLTVSTIFVNPLQFAPGEDLATYPRDPEGDAAKAASAGTDVLFAPPLEEMYPTDPTTSVSAGEIAEPLEGQSRPTFFTGVATVVAKLFSIAGQCHAYFGEKDYQQLMVVRRMVHDLSMPVVVVGCPIVREPDGLAMSSRNAYLEGADREAATVLYRALRHGLGVIDAGERDPRVVRATIEEVVGAEPRAELDYAAVVSSATLREPERLTGSARLLVAAQVGPARLIDNLGVELDG